MNSIQLVGRLVNDASFAVMQDGNPRCNFTLAVDRPTKRTNGREMTSDFFDCTAFRNTAKAAATYQERYNGYRKGDIVSVNGRGEFDTYTDPRTGQTVRRFQVIANEISCVYRKNPAQQAENYAPPAYDAPVYNAPVYGAGNQAGWQNAPQGMPPQGMPGQGMPAPNMQGQYPAGNAPQGMQGGTAYGGANNSRGYTAGVVYTR